MKSAAWENAWRVAEFLKRNGAAANRRQTLLAPPISGLVSRHEHARVSSTLTRHRCNAAFSSPSLHREPWSRPPWPKTKLPQEGVESKPHFVERLSGHSGGGARVIVAPAVGGRIVHYGLNAQNILYEQPGSEGKTPPTRRRACQSAATSAISGRAARPPRSQDALARPVRGNAPNHTIRLATGQSQPRRATGEIILDPRPANWAPPDDEEHFRKPLAFASGTARCVRAAALRFPAQEKHASRPAGRSARRSTANSS